MFAAFVINLPLVLERIELFYHKAHIQNLRADFRDLDQHLASRHEMVGLLSKLPEPGVLLDDTAAGNAQEIEHARQQYITWVNHIIGGQVDIVQITFLDSTGRLRYALFRNRLSGNWDQVDSPSITAPEAMIHTVLNQKEKSH